MTLDWTHGVIAVACLAAGVWIGGRNIEKLEIEVAGARLVATNFAQAIGGQSDGLVRQATAQR